MVRAGRAGGTVRARCLNRSFPMSPSCRKACEDADERLHFSVRIKSVREAEPKEIEHGHAHGVGSHRHD